MIMKSDTQLLNLHNHVQSLSHYGTLIRTMFMTKSVVYVTIPHCIPTLSKLLIVPRKLDETEQCINFLLDLSSGILRRVTDIIGQSTCTKRKGCTVL